MLGDPLAALPILNFALLKYSRHVAAYVVAMGGEVREMIDNSPAAGQQGNFCVAVAASSLQQSARQNGYCAERLVATAAADKHPQSRHPMPLGVYSSNQAVCCHAAAP